MDTLALDPHPVIHLRHNLGCPRPQAWACLRHRGWVRGLPQEVRQALQLLVFCAASPLPFPAIDDAFSLCSLELGFHLAVQCGGALGHVLVACAVAVARERRGRRRKRRRFLVATVIRVLARRKRGAIAFRVLQMAERNLALFGALKVGEVAASRSARGLVVDFRARRRQSGWPAPVVVFVPAAAELGSVAVLLSCAEFACLCSGHAMARGRVGGHHSPPE